MQKAIAKAAEREREIPLGAQEMAKHISKKKKEERKVHTKYGGDTRPSISAQTVPVIPCCERGPVSVEIFSVPDHTARFRAQCPQVII